MPYPILKMLVDKNANYSKSKIRLTNQEAAMISKGKQKSALIKNWGDAAEAWINGLEDKEIGKLLTNFRDI